VHHPEGPLAGYTPEMLEILKENKIKDDLRREEER